MVAYRPVTQDSEPMRLCPNCGARYEAPAQYCQRDGTRLHIGNEKKDPYLGTKILGQFRLETIIGSGGMGIVYGGWDEGLGRRVAIKILHQDLVANRDVVARFHREAQIAHHLDHPNIVRLILFGQLPDGNLHLVLEYLEGPTLLAAIEHDGPMAPARAVKIVAEIADAIGYAHRRDIIHRDLKPENVILVQRDSDPDHPKVLDFGIAKMLMGSDTLVTQTGLIFGTARYISPEGAQGEPVDKRSDVYSLGVITYQLLTSHTPFEEGEPVQLMLKQIHEPPPPMCTRYAAAQIPPLLESVVMRALAKSPAARYTDGAAYALALRQALAESDPESAIRSMVPTVAMQMYITAPGASESSTMPSNVNVRPATLPSQAPLDPTATLVGGSLAPFVPSLVHAQPLPPPPPLVVQAEPKPPSWRPPSPAMPNIPAGALPGTSSMRMGAPGTPSFGLNGNRSVPAAASAEDTARISSIESDEEIVVPGLPRRRPSREDQQHSTGTVRTVVISMLLTVLLGASAGWIFKLFPSQRHAAEREATINDLLGRAESALRAGHYAHEQHEGSGNDVEDLTDGVLSLTHDHARALDLRSAAARRLRNDAVQSINDRRIEHALRLLQSAARLADDDTEISNLIARCQQELRTSQTIEPTPSLPSSARLPPPRVVPRPPVRLRINRRPGQGPVIPEPSTEPVPAIPLGQPTFVPGRDPAQRRFEPDPSPVIIQPLMQPTRPVGAQLNTNGTRL